MRCDRVLSLWLCVAGLTVSSRWVVADQPARPAELPPAASRTVDFAADVLPILRASCFSCHGPEAQEGGLRLDVKSRALEGGDSGKVVVPGKSAESRLIQLVAGLDADTGPMPPEGEGTPLTADRIGILRAWIDQGAKWPDDLAGGGPAKTNMWSLNPLQRPALPAVRDNTWILNPIDAFVLARLEHEKIAPAPPADRSTLLRRLHFDLLGLPPTPEALNSYLSDTAPGAYERLVDRLLSSPHFGERWGRHWLDLARYADSDGYEKDRPRPFAWRYRNWVLDAVNGDLPYDQFTIQQIAGDLLPQATQDQLVATGFHRNTLHNTEGGADPEEDRFKKTIDRTNTVGSIWLGLTVGCAQCHSHKYDPLTQREYYQLYAFFNNLDEKDIDAPLALEQERYAAARAAYDREHAPLLAAIKQYEDNGLADAQLAWEKTALDSSVVWSPVDPASAVSQHGAELKEQPDLSLLATGENKVSDVYVVESSSSLKKICAVRLEVLPDASLVKQGPGRADNGNFVLSTFRVEAVPPSEGQKPIPLTLTNARADYSQNDCDVRHAINDNSDDFWAVGAEFGKRHVAVFEVQPPADLPDGTTLRFTLDQRYNRGQAHNLGRFRLSLTDSPGPITLDGLPAETATALGVPAADRTPDQQKKLRDFYRPLDKELQRLSQVAEKHAKKAPPAPATKGQTVAEHQPLRETNLLVRGDFLNPGDAVEPQSPAWLPPVEPRGEQLDRLDFSRWLVADENPLTARVAVNRMWERIFGRGIVATVDDFGRQGEKPSHPQLLDWLAAEFRDGGWSAKRLLRLVVTSQTYRQSSAVRTELQAIDPYNVLLAKQNRRRVEAEVIRDSSLAASGLLDPRIGGESVRPPQPSEYSKLTYANSASWKDSQGGDRYRRGLYTFFQRTSPYPMLMTFDAPDSNECCVQRESSNTPLQALTLWNDVAFFECAQSLARRIVAEIPATEDAVGSQRRRVEFAFVACLGRSPSEVELAELQSLFAQQWSHYQSAPEQAQATAGSAPLPAGGSVEEIAAWTVVGRVLLNLDEFITRE